MNLQFLTRLYNELDRKVEKFNLPCEKGCCECCDSIPHITLLEWRLIKKFLKGQRINKLNKDACPFLIDCACFIYPVRPVICRLYGWSYCISASTHQLEFLACKKISVKNPENFINFKPYWEMITIRSFFLDGGEPKPINEFLKTA